MKVSGCFDSVRRQYSSDDSFSLDSGESLNKDCDRSFYVSEMGCSDAVDAEKDEAELEGCLVFDLEKGKISP